MLCSISATLLLYNVARFISLLTFIHRMKETKEKLIVKIDALLARKADKDLSVLVSHQDFHVLAQVIDALHNGKRKVFSALPPEKQSDVAMVLLEDSKRRIFPRLKDEVIARFLHFCAEDDATDILQHISLQRRASILGYMKEDKRRKIEKLLNFGSETAGGLMDLNFIIVQPSFTLKDVLLKVQQHVEGKRDMPTVLVVDLDGKMLGFIPERTLLFPPMNTTVVDQTVPLGSVSHKIDREKVMELMSRMRSEILCVSDDLSRPIGIIHLRDLMKVAQAEATEDIFRFAGVDIEEHALDSSFSKVKRRYNWLLVNLITAFLASFVVGLFEGTIAKFAVLAVYMPIVAGQGGNTATQALAVVVRGLALGEITWLNAKKVVLREAFAGTMNGVITGIFAGLAAVAFGESMILGAILTVAMIFNLFIAGFFGALIPFVLKRCKIDPATASTVFVTTMTDVCGFFVFLGLGALFMR